MIWDYAPRGCWGPAEAQLRPSKPETPNFTSHSGHWALVLKFYPSWAAHATQTIPWIIVICSLKSWCSFSNMLLKKLMKLMFLPSDFLGFVPPSIKYQCWQLQEADSNGSGTLSVEAGNGLLVLFLFGVVPLFWWTSGFAVVGRGTCFRWGIRGGTLASKTRAPFWMKIHEVQRILERIGELNRAELLQKAEALGFTRKQAQALWETFEAWMVGLVLLGSIFADWLPRFLLFLVILAVYLYSILYKSIIYTHQVSLRIFVAVQLEVVWDLFAGVSLHHGWCIDIPLHSMNASDLHNLHFNMAL